MSITRDWLALTEGPVSCSAVDPDGDKLTYTWTADNGTITGSGDTISWTSPSAMGKYNITVSVSDGRGGVTKQSVVANVMLNADGSVSPDAPVLLKLSFLSSDNATAAKRVRIWTASAIECTVEGMDAKSVKYRWSYSNGRLQAARGLNLEEGTASKVNWIAPGVGGDFTVDVVATDSSGKEAKGTTNFKVFCCGN